MPKEYLKYLYNEHLNSDGGIEIESSFFQRSQILSEIEPETYEITFEEWENSRKEELLSKANKILGLYDNSKRFEKLKKAYNTRMLTPFIGAGLSMLSGYPSWTSFLYQLCEESDLTEEELDKLLKLGKYEEAAQELYNDLGNELFNEYLENEFSHEKNIIGAINYLPLLFNQSSIITTNFDNVLEKIFDGKDNGFDEIKSGKYLDEVIRKTASGSRILIKLHGDCTQIQDRVLTLNEYENAYVDTRVLSKFIERFIFKGTLLFLGCSLSNDRTISTMKKFVQEEGADGIPRHYTFMEEILDEKDRRQKKRELAKANIFPIWYPTDEHDESIEALFFKLMEDNL
ncbi:SIR2-like protein [Ancylomarina subtilis]|uniref:SIR2-like protein n=1 Tax=Ancylomarina subtilis TaxID=1639035 RepID=A0A4Q7VCI7_9BACT|nr:SIR2 family protein [Ancylomarina subtilis]RZT93577.1 SIR2-like protein [Ancylomarina subtilis]